MRTHRSLRFVVVMILSAASPLTVELPKRDLGSTLKRLHERLKCKWFRHLARAAVLLSAHLYLVKAFLPKIGEDMLMEIALL